MTQPAGITLAEALERGAFHPRQAVRAGRDVAAILAEQHQRGTAHGHVGPEDVLLGDDGVVHLSTSEEQGDPAQDVHDLGTMLREAIEVRVPSRSSQPVPPELPGLLERMTEPDPTARPTAAAVRDELAAMRLTATTPAGTARAATTPARTTVPTPPAPPATPTPPPVFAGEVDDAEETRLRRRPFLLALLALLLAAVAIALLVLVLGDDDGGDAAADPGASLTARSSSPPSTTATGPTADLARRIVAPPAPARQLGDEANGLGALDAVQLVKLGGDTPANQSAIVTALNELGFQDAHARAWSRSQGSTYSVVVYRFTTAAGAQELLTRLSRERPGTAFTSKTVPDAVSYSRRNGSQYEQAGSFVRGAFFFDITLATATEESAHATFDALLAAQRDGAERAG